GLIVSFDDRLTNSNYKRFFEQSLESYSQKKGDIQQFSKLLYRMQASKLKNRKK
ncbi:MAG: hypothetical protein E6445_12190, partial [Staphylococcus sp.]|nr:hypothetical protein [Staphylococcus sp.]